jgi:hypothetical protein
VRHCYLARFRYLLLRPDLGRPVADADKPALLIRQIRTPDVVLEPVSDPWARFGGTTQSVRPTARSPSKTAQSCDSVVPRRDERRLQ